MAAITYNCSSRKVLSYALVHVEEPNVFVRLISVVKLQNMKWFIVVWVGGVPQIGFAGWITC